MTSINKQQNEPSSAFTDTEIRQFIVDYLSKFDSAGVLERFNDIDTIDYLQQGFIDSFGLMHFVFELEETFKVEIVPDDMAQPSFRCVGGVIQTVLNKLKEL